MTKVNMLPAVFLISSCNSFVLTDPAIYINDYFFGFESDNVSAQAYSDSEYSFANIKIGRGPAANVVLAYVNDGIYEWRSNDGITIYTNNGIIVKTLGLEKDINYAILITTNAGLWRYKIGDTVKFTSLSPYKIIVTGRTKHYINVFGEEVIIENTDNVINKLSSKYNLQIVDYTVAPIFMKKNKKGAHQWFIEFKMPPSKDIDISEIIDRELKLENSDYEAKRYNSFTLKKPEIIISKKGVFLKWLELNNKVGGQNKIPRLSNERKFIESLIKLNN